MALKAEAEAVRDLADRIVRLVIAARLERLAVNESEDAEVLVTPAMRQQWSGKVEQLKSEIKTIVEGW